MVGIRLVGLRSDTRMRWYQNRNFDTKVREPFSRQTSRDHSTGKAFLQLPRKKLRAELMPYFLISSRHAKIVQILLVERIAEGGYAL
ncbi:MAG: hypothetical protein B7Z37_24480 [Verrucomicrobia bacterium 12-59-8]|nr:MAG: hypothetical protein B7Z37_24480 [Verrucomicrobia bacterium 12-59-8]